MNHNEPRCIQKKKGILTNIDKKFKFWSNTQAEIKIEKCYKNLKNE